MAAVGLDFPQDRRADWGWVLGESSLAGGLVVIANAQRAGRTRRSSEPERMVHRFAVELAMAARLKVVIVGDLPDARAWHRNLVVALQPTAGQERAEQQQLAERLADVDADALRALAWPRCAELHWPYGRRSPGRWRHGRADGSSMSPAY
ncbi:hypothetical protein ABIE67_006779 [Streptomyces sp. V4I8]|uniref:hypothetical protein n=1 Tax=Streptomyces sp. V4I8 TaxID=3156469 RepID=UPI003519AA93